MILHVSLINSHQSSIFLMRTYSYTVNGARYDVTIESLRDQVAKMNVNGIAFDVEILGAPLTESDLPEIGRAHV